jgi:hypothetical protein
MPNFLVLRQTAEPLFQAIEQVLLPDRCIGSDAMPDFVEELRQIEAKLAALLEGGEAERALRLYEVLLSACYEKLEFCDDSHGLFSLFFDSAFCGLTRARQAVSRLTNDTDREFPGMGCQGPGGGGQEFERDSGTVFDDDGLGWLASDFEAELDNELAQLTGARPGAIFEYSNQVRLPALALKDFYESNRDARGYAAVCDRVGFSPRDCERLAEIEMARSCWERALAWIERGQTLEGLRDWQNEVSCNLEHLKRELLV